MASNIIIEINIVSNRISQQTTEHLKLDKQNPLPQELGTSWIPELG